jgi:hypothetical protein
VKSRVVCGIWANGRQRAFTRGSLDIDVLDGLVVTMLC